MSKIPGNIKEVLDEVYETYMPLYAFELVALTHNELPWKNARAGLSPTDSSNSVLQDSDIIAQYTPLAENE